MTEWTRFQEGLSILRHYIPNDYRQYLRAADDKIYVAEAGASISPMQEVDRRKLEEYGFVLDIDSGVWTYHV